MPDELLTFRPRVRRVRFTIDGREVETDLFGFQDIPVKDSETFFELDNEIRTARAEGRFDYPAINACLRKQVHLICPGLEPEQIEALRPRQMQDAISASYEVGASPSPGAEATGAASPSASAASTTRSP